MNRSKTLIALMSGIAVAASVALFFLLTDVETREGRAWLSLGLVVLAELLLVAQFLRGSRPGERSIPGDAVRVTILTLYLAGVLVAAVLGSGLLRMPIRGYLVVHILLGVAAALSYGSISLFDRRGAAVDAGTRAGRLRIRDLALEVQGIRDRIEARLGGSAPAAGGSEGNALLDAQRMISEGSWTN